MNMCSFGPPDPSCGAFCETDYARALEWEQKDPTKCIARNQNALCMRRSDAVAAERFALYPQTRTKSCTRQQASDEDAGDYVSWTPWCRGRLRSGQLLEEKGCSAKGDAKANQ